MSAWAQELLAVALANALVASVLGVVAWLLLRRNQHRVAHFVCVMALLKLVTPPLVLLPLLAPDAPPQVDAAALVASALADADSDADATTAATEPAWAAVLVAAALLGSLALATRAALRTRRFRRLLRLGSEPPLWLALRARRLARRMQLRRCPELLVVPARISPMLCVLSRRAHILMPHGLLAAPAMELEALVAHELAHARRRDHWVRALELLVTLLYWWLPTAWLLRGTLRAAEERCCDEHVMATIPGSSRHYANALLATLDLLAGAARGMPPVACGAGAFTDMKTRLTMIMTAVPSRPMSWILRVALCAGAACVLPVAPTLAQDPGPAPISREELRAARQELRKLRVELEALRAELEREAKARDTKAAGGDEPTFGARVHKALQEKAAHDQQLRALHEKLQAHAGQRNDSDTAQRNTEPGLHQGMPSHDAEALRGLIETLHGRKAKLDAAGKEKVDQALLEPLHQSSLDKLQVDHEHLRGLLEHLHGQKSELDAAGKAKVEKALVEKLHKATTDKLRVEWNDVMEALQQRDGLRTDPESLRKAVEEARTDKLHKALLDKVQVEQDAVDGHKAELDAAHKALVERLHKATTDKLRVEWNDVVDVLKQRDGLRTDPESLRKAVEEARAGKLHKALLDKVQVEQDAVDHKIELDAAQKAKVEKALKEKVHKAMLDKVHVDIQARLQDMQVDLDPVHARIR